MIRVRATSGANESLKRARRLLKYPRLCRRTGTTLAEGLHLAGELCKHPELIRTIFTREGADRNHELRAVLGKLEHLNIYLLELPAAHFTSICPVENGAGIVCEISTPVPQEQVGHGDIVFLDGVSDPGNAGTIIRLSLAAGVSTIAVSDQCAYIWSPKVLRAGMGAHFFCRFIFGKSLKSIKEESGNQCLVADARGGKDLFAENWGERPTIWVFGNEGAGVSQDSLQNSDKTLLIPIDRRVESLNVASAASVCLFEQRRRRLLKSAT